MFGNDITARTETRRRFLNRGVCGLGSIALASLLTEQGRGAEIKHPAPPTDALRPRAPHFKPKAKRVLVLFMDGGVSQVDSFDPKPKLQAIDGQPFPMTVETTQFEQNGRAMGSPFSFQQYGQSGLPVSSLFPHMAEHADDFCLIRSMKSPFAEHAQSCYLMHTGRGIQGGPSLGAWTSYGLGTECAELPSYVVLNGGQLPLGGLANFASGFLPAVHAGSLFHVGAGTPVVDNIVPHEADPGAQRRMLGFVDAEDREFIGKLGSGESTVESAVRNYELAFEMQTAVPAATEFTDETAATLDRYGVTSANKFEARYARECLLARRLLERGVRFVELTCVAGLRSVSPWDSHTNIKEEHPKNAQVVDRPIAALLSDLKMRGLLDDTLVVWGSEFGRTPFAQGSTGRDHGPQGFSIWLAGGGVRGGMTYGATDELGYHAVENVVTIHDLHATILHLLGFDHTRLTFRFQGRDFRLTDVHGNVLTPILA